MAKRRQRSELPKIMSNKERSNGEWKISVAWEAVNKDASNHYLLENKGHQKYFFLQHGGNLEPPCHRGLRFTELGMT